MSIFANGLVALSTPRRRFRRVLRGSVALLAPALEEGRRLSFVERGEIFEFYQSAAAVG